MHHDRLLTIMVDPVSDCLTFQDVSTQVNTIAKGIAQLTEHVNRCVEWWGRMRAGLKSLKDELPKVIQDGHQSSQSLTGDVADGWIDVADQFALCVYKVRCTMISPHRPLLILLTSDESRHSRLHPPRARNANNSSTSNIILVRRC